MISKIVLGEKLGQFVKEYADDPYCLELLQFFGKHPHTRFSRLAIAHCLNGGRLYSERALRYLINNGVIKAHIENKTPLYSLTKDEPLCGLVRDIARLDRSQWQLVLQQLDLTSAEQGSPRSSIQVP